MAPEWLQSLDLNLDDAVITLDAEGRIIALNDEADRLALDGDPHGTPLEAAFPIRDEFSGRPPTGLTRSVVLPMRAGELRAFDLLAVPLERGRGWTVILRPAIGSGDEEHEAWANLSKGSKEGTGLGDPTTGTIGLVSNSFAALHGYTPEEMLGMPASRLFAEDNWAVQEMEARLRAGSVSWEALHLRKDGSTFPVLLSVTTIRDPLGQARFRAMRIEDISDRKGAETREAAGRQLLERVVAAVPSIVYLLHPEKGEMRFLSQEVAATLGYPPGTGPPPDTQADDPRFTSESLHLDDHAGMRAHRARLPDLADAAIATFEYRIRDVRGQWRWFLSRDTVFEREEDGRVKTILGTATDITGTKESERQEAYLVALSDALRPLADSEEIQAVAVRIFAEHLTADRAVYVELREDQDLWLVRADYAPQLSSGVSTYRVSDFAAHTNDVLRWGETLVVSDTEKIPGLSLAECEAYAAIGVRAYLNVPLIKDGRLTNALSLQSATPRRWTSSEILLAEQTAERTWAAVERAHAEKELAVSERLYRDLFDSMEEGFAVLEVLFDAEDHPTDWIFLETNPAFERQSGYQGFAGKSARELLPGIEQRWIEFYGHTALTGERARVLDDSVVTGRTYRVDTFRLGGESSRRVAVLFSDVTGDHRSDVI